MFGTNSIDHRQVAAGALAAIGLVVVACGGPAREIPPHPSLHSPQHARAPEWHYEGAEGPANWGTLSPTFAACSEGRHQSPIDITKATPGATVPLRTAFPPAELRIVHHEHIADGINNGHTIQINYPDAETLTLGGVAYQLTQYHFHSPSEHTVDGKRFPMEMHLVHRSADDRLAVVGVFIAEGAHNKAFDPVWANLPARRVSRRTTPRSPWMSTRSCPRSAPRIATTARSRRRRARKV